MFFTGAVIHIVEIDPLVISASVQAMGFPSFSIMMPSDERAFSKPSTIDEVLWKGIHERLFLYEADAEKFILEKKNNLYDMIFIDAYDGDDIFPQKLWDPHAPFLKALSNQLHPEHGTVVVNLHADSDILAESNSYFHQQLQPVGRHLSSVCRAYKDVILGNASSFDGNFQSGLGFSVSVPWVCNATLVVCRGFRNGGSEGYYNRDLVLNTLISKSFEVEDVLDLPFPCMQYIKRGFALSD